MKPDLASRWETEDAVLRCRTRLVLGEVVIWVIHRQFGDASNLPQSSSLVGSDETMARTMPRQKWHHGQKDSFYSHNNGYIWGALRIGHSQAPKPKTRR